MHRLCLEQLPIGLQDSPNRQIFPIVHGVWVTNNAVPANEWESSLGVSNSIRMLSWTRGAGTCISCASWGETIVRGEGKESVPSRETQEISCPEQWLVVDMNDTNGVQA